MLNGQKLTFSVAFSLIFFVNASVRNEKSQESAQDVFKEHSSNEIPSEEKKNSADEQHYYLPLQTEFGVTEIVTGAGSFSATLPPHLTIKPAPMRTTYQQSATSLHEDSSAAADYYNVPLQGQCVSETPANELQSHLLVSSKDIIKESVIMSGHLEIASKTSSVEEVSEINNFISQPSIALQGTILYPHTIADL